MKNLLYITLLIFTACGESFFNFPDSQNLIAVEGWITDSVSNQSIRVTRSNGFSDKNRIPPIQDAQITVQSRTGQVYEYSYIENGYYVSNVPYQGMEGVGYRVQIMIDSEEIRSDWDIMPKKVSIQNLELDSFEQEDPDNQNQKIVIYYPKTRILDLENIKNYYRWIFLKNNKVLTDPESITIQNDRLFDGNLLSSDFQHFEYDTSDIMTIRLQSISSKAFNYLSQLKSQMTTLGTSIGTVPARVSGNLNNMAREDQQVLGFFGAIAISVESIKIPEEIN